ncbi:hypothetical protein SAMN05421821_12732 [Mucilaginibacter lappiensis]|uniref:Ribosomal protein L14 n=1 Tax=Mucilaginibacter lappiensis TaxID=354630 RepID=A0ABR6PTC2_9SPHI|nr:hypothetical protein [Mucilaginibacter lappiensis]MBB6113033.1 ribosomal protein L14 [Mucilaginibacter lappiensis]SIS11102.1 hypothetical protein SAMN05421821_12732 [Mucilaginibacter lappiensis]
MRETDAIVAEVREALTAKQEEINKAGDAAIAYVKEAFKKRQKEFVHFERNAAGLTCTASQKPSVIDSYKKDAEVLLGEISRILV